MIYLLNTRGMKNILQNVKFCTFPFNLFVNFLVVFDDP